MPAHKYPVPLTMAGMQLTEFGGPDKLVYRTDLAVPEPLAGEVLVQVGACGINNTDIWTREGAYGADAEGGWRGSDFVFPRIQGADGVGQIVRIGAGVAPERIGQRVMVNATLYPAGENALYRATYIGSERDGAFAEYLCVPDANALAINSPLTDAQLATFMTSYLTAEHMLNRAGLKAGETLLVTGASGGVGSALLQLARLRGAKVVAVIHQNKAHFLDAWGIDAIVYRGDPHSAQTISQQLGQRSVDVVADVVAGKAMASWLDLLAVGGRYVVAGAIDDALVSLDLRKLYLRHLSLLGATMGTQDEARQIVAFVEQGRLQPLLFAIYKLQQLAQAQLDFKGKAHFGKLVIVP